MSWSTSLVLEAVAEEHTEQGGAGQHAEELGALVQQLFGPPRLRGDDLGQSDRGDVLGQVRLDAPEEAQVLGGQVDPAAHVVLGDVLAVLDDLQHGAHLVRKRCPFRRKLACVGATDVRPAK
jgi:hypothetical protein